MASTAKKMKKTAEEIQSSAESKLKDVRAGIEDAGHEVAYQAESMKRNPLAMTLLILLGLGALAAILALLKNNSD